MSKLPREDRNDYCDIYVYPAGDINGISGLIWKQYTNRTTKEVRYSLVDSSETWEWRWALDEWRPVGTSQIENGYSISSRWTEAVMEKVKPPFTNKEPIKAAGTPEELKIAELSGQLEEANLKINKLMEICKNLSEALKTNQMFIVPPS